MSSLPDGIIFSMKSVDKGTGVEFKEVGKLVKCKNCVFSSIIDYPIAEKIVAKDTVFCKAHDKCTSPEGYCWWGTREEDCDG